MNPILTTEAINKLKAGLTESDLAHYNRDRSLKAMIDAAIDNPLEHLKFLMLLNITFIMEHEGSLEDFITDLKEAHDLISQIECSPKSGH